MAWIEGQADGYFDFVDEITEIVTSDSVASVAVGSSGGTGYVVGDILTLAGGTSTHAGQVEVTSVSSGVVDGVRVYSAGAYTADPTLTDNAATGGTGSGVDIDVTMNSTNYVTSAAPNAAGSSYIVGDVLTVAGGTSPTSATLEVTKVNGSGGIVELKPQLQGAYTADPTLTANSVTGGTGSGATVDITMSSTGWTVLRRSQEAVSATVASGGTGYAVSDTITLAAEDSVGNSIDAVFTVATLSGSAVATVTLQTAGLYEETHKFPGDIAQGSTSGSGTGCELNVTFQNATDQNESVVIFQAPGDGSQRIFSGMRLYQETDGVDDSYNISLSGFSGYNNGLTFANQAGISPGDDRVVATGGSYMIMRDSNGSFPIDFEVSVTTRRMTGGARISSASTNFDSTFHLGLLNQNGTETEFPYPNYIMGSTSRYQTTFTTTAVGEFTGLAEAIQFSGSPGPGFYYRTDSVWQAVANSTSNGSTRSKLQDFVLYPVGQPDNTPSGTASVDLITDESSLIPHFEDIAPLTGVPGTVSLNLEPTPESGTDITRLYAVTLTASTSSFVGAQGELEGVFWFSATNDGTTIVSQDRITIGTDRYRVYQCGNRALSYTRMAIRED